MKQVVLIGDSIRMGYEPIVRRELDGLADVSGPKDNGRTSRNILDHLDEWVLARSFDVLHINCGLHDLARPRDTQAPAIPLDRYEQNVREILKRLLDHHRAGKVIWATTTPVNEKWHHENKGFDRHEADVEAYNAAAMKVTAEFGVTVNDLNAVIAKARPAQHLTKDGVPFTAAGYELLGKAVAEFVRPFLER